MDNGMEKMAPPPVPTHRRLEMTVRDEIWRGDSVRKAGPTEGDGGMSAELQEKFTLKVVKIYVLFLRIR